MILFLTPGGSPLPYDPDTMVTGYIPSFLNGQDDRPAREQLHENYRHGGGWRPFPGMGLDLERRQLTYPGDPPRRMVAMARLRTEKIYLFESSWVAIVQPDGSYEVARMD